MPSKKTVEPQYQDHVSLRDKKGLSRLGLRATARWDSDPRLLLIALARYKFVAKMLSGKKKVLEVGCGDAFETRMILQEVESVCAIDFDPVFIKNAYELMDDKWKFECRIQDILECPVEGPFDAAYALDVLEHIPKKNEQIFMRNIARSLEDNGVLIVGMPSIQSQVYASELSKAGHVNCKDHLELKSLMLQYYHNVFIFSMNDEVVHTGFYPMAHYLFALGVGRRKL